MKVLALSDSLAPWHSFWIRFGQYSLNLPWLVSITDNPAEIKTLKSGDRLFIYRYAPSWGDLTIQLRQIRAQGVVVLSDLDDYLWQANGWNRQRLLGCTRALRECDVISCSTPELLQQVRVMFPAAHLELLPNTAPKLPNNTNPKAITHPLRIGWTGAPWTRPDDLTLLKPLASWIVNQPEKLKLVHVGHSDSHMSLAEVLELKNPDVVETRPLQSHSNYLKQLDFDIGLAPLAPNNFNYYKSAVKVLEYSALGIPWLASRAQPYQELCREWQWPGRLCAEPMAWIQQLEPLLDPTTRRQEGQQLQTLCKQHASYTDGIKRWHRLLLDATSNRNNNSRE